MEKHDFESLVFKTFFGPRFNIEGLEHVICRAWIFLMLLKNVAALETSSTHPQTITIVPLNLQGCWRPLPAVADMEVPFNHSTTR